MIRAVSQLIRSTCGSVPNRQDQGVAKLLCRLATVSDCDRRIHVLSAIAEAG
jgi:hypothetical protein